MQDTTPTNTTPPKPYDLVIEAERVMCPARGVDAPSAIAVRADRIVASGPSIQPSAAQTIHFPDAVLLPGLIDLHAHPACRGSVFGVEPDRDILPRGTTTVCSQGDAGADNIAEYVEETILASRARVRLAINLSRVGESTEEGCFDRLEYADVDLCVAAAEEQREFIWAIAVNVSSHACGTTDPREIMRRGLAAASRTGLPLLFGMRRPEDWPLSEQLALLRGGDVVTYCFRRQPHCIVENGRVLPAVLEAREQGVLFDVGHGMASFDFDVAEAAIADGFCPDTISTDLQARHIDQEARHDLPLVMSKLLAAGMPEADIIAGVTATPARLLGLQEKIGSLVIGRCADLTVLQAEPDAVLTDCSGNHRRGPRWKGVLTVRAGTVVYNASYGASLGSPAKNQSTTLPRSPSVNSG
ncbi:MAG: hypothetical protein CMJ64_03315 [Planctomycetaceae bacterium]|nr:hypothetical protein [Planctomycetaceae bacterium]